MDKHTALKIAIAALEAEMRSKRQAYEKYRQGFHLYQSTHDRYLQLCEAITALRRLLAQL